MARPRFFRASGHESLSAARARVTVQQVEPLMRVLRLHVDYGHRIGPNVPALHLFAGVIQDAVDLVQGVARKSSTLKSGPVEVAAARRWIRNGNVGVLTFNQACGYLGWDAEILRRAIFSPPRGAG
jgi:hypothetical protein